MEKKSKPRLLVLLSRVPYPLDKGDKLRAFNQIKGLSEDFNIILVCLNTGKVDEQAFKVLNPYCENVHVIQLNRFAIAYRLVLNAFRNKPYQIAFFYSKQAQKELDIIVEKYLPRKFYCQLIRVAEYARKYSIFEKSIDYMDALSAGMERRIETAPKLSKPIIHQEAKRLKQYENEVYTLFDNKVIISDQDRELIEHPSRESINVIPNGISEQYFEPLNLEKEYDICFTGNMLYPPNVEGAQYIVKKVLPLINQKRDHKVLISGKSPSILVRRLANKNIHVSGWVEDMRVSYARSKVFVAPMIIGSGLQNKLLEAMASGIPCVTTSLANTALGAIANESILIANTPEEFAEHIETLLEMPEKADRIGKAGQDFVRENFSWKYWNKELVKLIS